MKFLVIWELQPFQPEIINTVLRMPDYARKLADKLLGRYHMVGKHGGAWIYDVESNEELERLLAMAPVYNYSHYDVFPLADMQSPSEVLQSKQPGGRSRAGRR